MGIEITAESAFDYGGLDPETRIVVQQRTSEIRTIARRAATDIIEIGQKLIEVKGRLGHGRFGEWLQAEFAWTDRTARGFMGVAERFKSEIISDLNMAPTVLYMLSAPSVPDEARQEALQRAQAGERVTVAKAQDIIEEHKPARPATVDELRAPVQKAITALAHGDAAALRNILQQIDIGSPAGADWLLRAQAAPDVPKPSLIRDVRAVCVAWLAEIRAQGLPPARTEHFSPGESFTPIWKLQQEIRNFLAKRSANLAAGETSLSMLQGICKRFPAQGRVDYDDLRMNEGNLTRPYREGDLQQALNNVLDQMRHETIVVEPDGPGVRSDAEVDAEASRLEPAVWAYLVDGPAYAQSERAGLEWADKITASLLDLEGWHARRGHNYDWEALVGKLGNDVDHEALRRAIRRVRERLLQRLGELGEQPSAISRSEGSQQPSATPDVVEQWLGAMVEENEIPAGRDGKADPEAVRIVLGSMLRDRDNGGGLAWRQLKKHPGWLAGTTDAEKIARVREALERLAPLGKTQPVEIWPAAQPVRTERRQEALHGLIVAANRALGVLKAIAALHDEPDADLVESIVMLEGALAQVEAVR